MCCPCCVGSDRSGCTPDPAAGEAVPAESHVQQPGAGTPRSVVGEGPERSQLTGVLDQLALSGRQDAPAGPGRHVRVVDLERDAAVPRVSAQHAVRRRAKDDRGPVHDVVDGQDLRPGGGADPDPADLAALEQVAARTSVQLAGPHAHDDRTGTTATGHVACSRTAVDTEPTNSRSAAGRWWVPTTSRSARVAAV